MLLTRLPALSGGQTPGGVAMYAVSRFLKDESGATAIEYGLIAALIAVAIIGALTTVGSKMGTMYNNISGKL
jgi:pilus assembly protein Flp/PilA